MNLELYCQTNKNIYNQQTQKMMDNYGYIWNEKKILKEPKEILEKVSLQDYKNKIVVDNSIDCFQPKMLVIN